MFSDPPEAGSGLFRALVIVAITGEWGILAMSVKLVFCVILSLLLSIGCSSSMVAEKVDSETKRPRILEEDITDSAKVPVPEPANAPAAGPGLVLPGGASPGSSSLPPADPSASPRAPRRFQWKDSR